MDYTTFRDQIVVAKSWDTGTAERKLGTEGVIGFAEVQNSDSLTVVYGKNYSDTVGICPRRGGVVRVATQSEITEFKKTWDSQESDGTMEMLSNGNKLMSFLGKCECMADPEDG